MKFLKNLLAFFLVMVIVGGVGFIGYNVFFVNHTGHDTSDNIALDAGQGGQNNSTNNTSGHTNTGSGSDNTSGNSIGINHANIILKNKENVSNSVAVLDEAMKLLTVDPYAPVSDSKTMTDMGQNQENGQHNNTAGIQNNTQTGNTTAPNQEGNNTIINIYPQGQDNVNTPNNTMSQSNTAMHNMGTLYDPYKMEQLHNGLYKISVGMTMLKQLETQLSTQAEYSVLNTQNPVNFYTTQYNLTIHNRQKLGEAINYIKEATNLVNINPYVSSEGLVYDKDRMNQIHQGVFKLASGVASLSLINDDLTTQTIQLSSTVQGYMNGIASNNHITHGTQQGIFDSILGSMNIRTVVNIVLILFVIGLILGIIGFASSLFKPAKKLETF